MIVVLVIALALTLTLTLTLILPLTLTLTGALTPTRTLSAREVEMGKDDVEGVLAAKAGTCPGNHARQI